MKNAEASLGSGLKNPILDIAASFWEEERYRAFRTCYSSMRRMDDLVDDLRSSGDTEELHSRTLVEEKLLGEMASLIGDNELAETLRVFKIPIECWRRLAGAMHYDLSERGFPTFLSFRRYAEGAAVAPAAVFIHLIGLKKEPGFFSSAPVDIFANARSMALFSYLTHIIRDFRKDCADNLEYIPEDLRREFGVDSEIWLAAAAGSQRPEFTSLVREIHRRAQYYRNRSNPERLPIMNFLTERYSFSLYAIWELYSLTLELIEESGFILDPELITPSREQILNRLSQLAREQRLDSVIFEEGLSRLGVS